MAVRNHKLVPILLAVAALLLFIPGVKSLVTGGSHNVAFTVIAIFFLLLAIATSRKFGSGRA